jgi:hypothetical protein
MLDPARPPAQEGVDTDSQPLDSATDQPIETPETLTPETLTPETLTPETPTRENPDVKEFEVEGAVT